MGILAGFAVLAWRTALSTFGPASFVVRQGPGILLAAAFAAAAIHFWMEVGRNVDRGFLGAYPNAAGAVVAAAVIANLGAATCLFLIGLEKGQELGP